MTARHTRTRILKSPVGLAATAAVAVTALIGGTVGAVQLTGSPTSEATPVFSQPADPAAGDPDTAIPGPAATSAQPSSSPTRASRGSARKAVPSTPKPSARKSSPAGRVVETGSCGASFYDEPQPTANGETFDAEALTAAHKTLPFNTRVRVVNPTKGKSVTVRINDRGPYIDGRCLDLSRAAFRAIAPLDLGELTVRYEILGSSAG